MKKVSTKDIRTKGFAPHGSMELAVLDRLNVIEAKGPFNLELVKAGDVVQEKLDADLQAKFLTNRQLFGASTNFQLGNWAMGSELSFRPKDAIALNACQ